MATQFAVIIRMEGVAALWSGLRPALGTVVPATAIYMSLYDTLKEQHTPLCTQRMHWHCGLSSLPSR